VRIRRLPVPIAFFVVVAATVFLVIFFGAWAASSAKAGSQDRTLSFGFVNSGANLDASAQSAALAAEGAGEDGGDVDESWWQTAFIKVCPLH
jgi:hypothetical protein